jgi:hypothetical protein
MAEIDPYENDAFIHTRHGMFRWHEPTFRINDIAHALGMNCRFNGHTEYFYSVAEHSLLVADLMSICQLGDPREGLLHDAAEAYLTDVPSPWKQFLPDWKAVDARWDLALREHFGLGEKTHGCKVADYYALFIEANELIDGKGEDFKDPMGLRQDALYLMRSHNLYPLCYAPHVAKARFLRRAEELGFK